MCKRAKEREREGERKRERKHEASLLEKKTTERAILIYIVLIAKR